jgi:hypothetical protein
MAVKEKVNKSAEIRKVYSSGVKSAAEIVSQLKSAGVKVTPALVYNVLSHKKGKKKKKSNVPEHSEEKETVFDHAIVFVKSAGGMQKARELLSKLALLKD